jgi:hypothetical protein
MGGVSVLERASVWIRGQTAGQIWWYRLPVLVVLAWIFLGYTTDALAGSIFSGINLGFHEMGHALFFWSGNRVMTTAGGTLSELAIPIAAGVYLLLRQRDPFGAAVCVFWLGTALVGAGIYAADARAQALPLVSPFGPVDFDSHDWTFLLMKYGKLSKDAQIGGALQSAGMASMALSLALGAWVLRVMARKTSAMPEEGLEPPTRGL